MDTDVHITRLERLLAGTRRVFGEADPARLLDVALEVVVSHLQADHGFVLLRDGEGRPRLRATLNVDRETLRGPGFRPLRGIADHALRHGEPFLSASLDADTRVTPESSIGDASRSVIVVPLRAPDGVLGVLCADRYHDGASAFSVADLRALQIFADVVGIALQRLTELRTLSGRVNELRRTQATLERMTTSLHEEVAAKSVELARFERDLDSKTRALHLKYGFGNIVGRSAAMQVIFDVLRRVADYSVPVLIIGESGTGKELLTRALHHESPRAAEPFLAINCAAIPENLLESELFGYKKGAFTGANQDKDGLFIAARGGTVFLDEIGEMPQSLQAKLLRVLQEREVRPVGGHAAEPVGARIVAATKRRLREEVDAGGFREDLYYRLNVVEIEVPPLRTRLEDLPVLVDHFLDRLAAEVDHLPRRRLTPAALQRLMSYQWPGNVRQLENTVQSSAILSAAALIEADELRMPPPPPAAVRPAVAAAEAQSPHVRTRDDWERQEKEAILDALVRSRWNKTRAAELLGVSRRNLYRKLARYGIEGAG